MGLAWHSLVLQLPLARLRAGYICFVHLDGKRSSAKRQRCVFCDEPTLSPSYHVLCKCQVWVYLRELSWGMLNQERPSAQAAQLRVLFGACPGAPGYGCMLAWAGSLERDAKAFWARH